MARRDKIHRILQEIIERHTDPWGVKATTVEAREVVLPFMKKNSEAQMEALLKSSASRHLKLESSASDLTHAETTQH